MRTQLFIRAALTAVTAGIILSPLWAQEQETGKKQQDQRAPQKQSVEETVEAENQPSVSEAVEAAFEESDLAAPEENKVALHNLAKLQDLTSEVEARLETLVNLMTEERQSITEREEKLVQREASLAARAAEVAAAEQGLTTQKTVSWVVLALGVGAIIFAFVVPRGNTNKPGLEPKGLSHTDTKVQPKVVNQEPGQERELAEASNASATKKKADTKTSANDKARETVAASNNASDSNGKKKATAD